MKKRIECDDRGRLTIPKLFRENYNIKRGSKFDVISNDDLKLILVKERGAKP